MVPVRSSKTRGGGRGDALGKAALENELGVVNMLLVNKQKMILVINNKTRYRYIIYIQY